MEFYPRNEEHARRELRDQLNLFDPPPVAEVEQPEQVEAEQPKEQPKEQRGDILYTVDNRHTAKARPRSCAEFVRAARWRG